MASPPAPCTAAADAAPSDRWRYGLFIGAAISALAIAIPVALQFANTVTGYAAVRAFVFRATVYALAVFVPLIALASIAVYAHHQRNHAQPDA